MLTSAIDLRTIPPGLYRLHWRAGGSDLAAVGRHSDGSRWFAPCDWVTGVVSTEWHLVSRAERIDDPGSDGGA